MTFRTSLCHVPSVAVHIQATLHLLARHQVTDSYRAADSVSSAVALTRGDCAVGDVSKIRRPKSMQKTQHYLFRLFA